MTFDAGELNDACVGIGDPATLITKEGPKPVTAIISIGTDIDSTGVYDIDTDVITAETDISIMVGMARGDQLVQDGISYEILSWKIDSTDWVVIRLEKV